MKDQAILDLSDRIEEVATDVAVIKSNISLIGKAFILFTPFVLGFMGWLTLRVIDMPTKDDIKQAQHPTIPDKYAEFKK